MSDLTGQQLGHYRLIHKIGSGGFAHVYQAEHIYLNTPVAIKVLITNLASGDMQNFLNEAQVVARLDHPHIVRVRDFGIEGGIPYLVMDYAPNGTLRQRHPKGMQVALPLVVTYVEQLASALQYAHTQHMIHRDVKPDNILLGSNNKLLLSDFGAALVTRTTQKLSPQNIIGTLSYMAPEQLQGNPSPASDQYALGVVIYEWLCGYCPFEGPAAMYSHLNLPPPPLRAKVPTLPYEIEQVVMRALAKYPVQRFDSVQSFAEAFERASKRAQTPPLFLPGDASSRGSSPMLATQTMVAPSPQLPPLVAPSLPVTPLPVTIMAASSFPSKPPVPRSSRRTALGLFGLAALGATTGVLALVLTNQGPGGKKPTPTPKPAATPIPTKNKAVYTYKEHQDEVFTAVWSPPDGRYIASAGGGINGRLGDNSVRVWNALTGQDVSQYTGHSHVVRKVAWSPDGTRIASASEDMTVQVWDAATGGNKPTLTYTHKGGVMAVAWSPDGKRIASASRDQTVQVWDATTGEKLCAYGHVTAVIAIAWSPDGTRIVSAGLKSDQKMVNDVDKIVKVWDAATGVTLSTCGYSSAQAGALAWSPKGKDIAIGYYNTDEGADDSVRMWDTITGNDPQILPGKFNDQVYAADWSPRDGKYLAIGYNWSEVKIWNSIADKQILTYLGHNRPVMSVQWSPNGKYIASCGFDKTVQIWTLS